MSVTLTMTSNVAPVAAPGCIEIEFGPGVGLSGVNVASIAPPIVAASLKVFEMLESSTELADRVKENTKYFRDAMATTGFTMSGTDHPISPVMLGDAALSQKFSNRLLDHGVYAIGFFFPVVPRDQARIRTQISAAHTRTQLDQAIDAFIQTGKELGVI